MEDGRQRSSFTQLKLCRNCRWSGEVIAAPMGPVCARGLGVTELNVVVAAHEIGEET